LDPDDDAHPNGRAAVAAAYADPPPVVYESCIRLITGEVGGKDGRRDGKDLTLATTTLLRVMFEVP
jgi:hypothetical protein